MLAQSIIYYQMVQQYRNQINHANDSALSYQCAGLLPLTTNAIGQLLSDVAFYLQKMKDRKPNIPANVAPLDLNKKF